MQVGDVRADFDDLTAKFVANDEWDVNGGSRPFIPIVNVQIGAADARGEHANLDVVNAVFGFGNVFEPQSAFGAAFDEGFHRKGLLYREDWECPRVCSARLQAGTVDTRVCPPEGGRYTYSRSTRFGPETATVRTFSGRDRDAPSTGLGFRLDF